jgi:hypothetical protein
VPISFPPEMAEQVEVCYVSASIFRHISPISRNAGCPSLSPSFCLSSKSSVGFCNDNLHSLYLFYHFVTVYLWFLGYYLLPVIQHVDLVIEKYLWKES